MQNRKLTELLRALTSKEFSEFGDYIRSPFFNKSDLLVKLYDVLKRYYPSLDNDGFSKQRIFNELYPGEEYNDKKLRDRLRDMLKHFEDFLAYTELKKRPLTVKRLSLKKLSTTLLDKHFDRKLNEIQEILDKRNIKDDIYFYNSYFIRRAQRNQRISRVPLGKSLNLYDSMKEEIEDFTIYVTIELLKYYIILLNLKNHVHIKVDYQFLDELSEIVKQERYYKYPFLKIIYGLIKLGKGEGSEYDYFQLKSLLLENKGNLEKDDLELACIQLYNYGKSQVLAGDEKFRKENFEFLKRMLEIGIYPSENGYMTESSYMSFASQAMTEKEYGWAEKFINEYKERVAPVHRKNSYEYIVSILEYYRKNYTAALRGLSKVKAMDFYYNLRIKNYLARIHFELKEYDSTLRIINSLRAYISINRNIPERIKTRFKNFLSYLSRLINIKFTYDGHKAGKLSEDLRKDNDTENKEWLTERINELVMES